jgi:hypothetical protein
MPGEGGWSEIPPSWALPVTVPGPLVLVRGEGMLAWIAPMCAYPTGFLFSLAINLNLGDAGELGIDFDARPPRDQASLSRLWVRFDGAVVDSAEAMNGRAVAGQPVLRDRGWSSRYSPVRAGYPSPRHVSSWWVSPLPRAGPVEFAVFLPGAAGRSGSARMEASLITSAARRSVVLWAEPETDPQ